MDEDTSWKWKNLGLVLQTAEGSRKYQPVVIPLEFSAVVFTRFVDVFQSEAFVGYELFPVHDSRL